MHQRCSSDVLKLKGCSGTCLVSQSLWNFSPPSNNQQVAYKFLLQSKSTVGSSLTTCFHNLASLTAHRGNVSATRPDLRQLVHLLSKRFPIKPVGQLHVWTVSRLDHQSWLKLYDHTVFWENITFNIPGHWCLHARVHFHYVLTILILRYHLIQFTVA